MAVRDGGGPRIPIRKAGSLGLRRSGHLLTGRLGQLRTIRETPRGPSETSRIGQMRQCAQPFVGVDRAVHITANDSKHACARTRLLAMSAVLVELLLVFPGAAAEAGEPCAFARSGTVATVQLSGSQHPIPDRVALRVHGRIWQDSWPIEDGKLTLAVPDVRVSTVFSIISTDRSQAVLAEFIVYPDGLEPWPREDIRVYVAGAPAWFEQWTHAVKLPLRTLDIRQPLGRALAGPDTDGELLVIGRKHAGQSPEHVVRLARRGRINLLVLDADWGLSAVSGTLNVGPKTMRAALKSVGDQIWPRTLTFDNVRTPSPLIMNRRFWIEAEHGPLAEQVGRSGTEHAVVLSYVPWNQQLGREELADDLLLTLLRAAAKPLVPLGANQQLTLDWIGKNIADGKRPILTAAHDVARGAGPYRVAVLDLRGNESPSSRLRASLRRLEAQTTELNPLLILGDARLLDTWAWLGMDRKRRMTKERPGLRWLPDDELPPSPAAQLRLMNALTLLGVPLTDDQWSK